MRVFVVLDVIFSTPSPEIGFGKRLRNDIFSVDWDVKPQLNEIGASQQSTDGSGICKDGSSAIVYTRSPGIFGQRHGTRSALGMK